VWAGDGECDEPYLCDTGTDCDDCGFTQVPGSSPLTPVCGCESVGEQFCNYDDGDSGACESCGDVGSGTRDGCGEMGLPAAGVADCELWCFDTDATPAEPPDPPKLSPPPPWPSPPPLPPMKAGESTKTVHEVQVRLTAAGDLTDYTSSMRRAIATAIADVAGVDASLVTVQILEGSVLVVATVVAADKSGATSIRDDLSEALDSASSASSLLAIDVTSAPMVALTTRTVVVGAPSEPPAQPSGALSPALLAVATALPVLALIGLIIAVACFRRRRGKVHAAPSPVVPAALA